MDRDYVVNFKIGVTILVRTINFIMLYHAKPKLHVTPLIDLITKEDRGILLLTKLNGIIVLNRDGVDN